MTVQGPMWHGIQFSATAPGESPTPPCSCPTEELTVIIPVFVADQMRREAAKSGNTVDAMVAGAFRHVQTGEHAPVDPCRAAG